MKKLQINARFALPLEVVTESMAILAKRRAGKSYTARKVVEQLHAANQQVVVLDPKGDWWGIRSSADGKGPGLPFVIVGGEHGDVPLEARSGEAVADLVVRQRASVLIDLSELRKNQLAMFCAAFLESVYRLKARSEFQTPLMLVIDEADAIAPQNPRGTRTEGEFDNTPRMLGAAEDLVRRGGQRGIGVVLVSQRAAVLNKNVLTQTGILVLLKTTGSQDLDAVDEWIKKHGEPEKRAQVMASLAKLEQGEAWFWAPGWPTGEGIFLRERADPIETFDSGRTPKPGETRKAPKRVADVDLDAFRAEMAETIRAAEARDPKKLQAKIVELERTVRELEKRPKESERVEVPVITDAQLEAFAAVKQAVADAHERISETARQIRESVDDVLRQVAHAAQGFRVREDFRLDGIDRALEKTVPNARCFDREPDARKNGRQPDHATVRVRTDGEGRVKFVPPAAGEPLGKGPRAFLTVLAQHEPSAVDDSRLALTAGYSVRSSTFRNILSTLRTSGFIAGGREGFTITDAGLAALGEFEPLPEGSQLREYWLAHVGRDAAPGKVLAAAIGNYPDQIERDHLAELAGLSPTSSTYRNALSTLRTLTLIEGSSAIRASSDLFTGARR